MGNVSEWLVRRTVTECYVFSNGIRLPAGVLGGRYSKEQRSRMAQIGKNEKTLKEQALSLRIQKSKSNQQDFKKEEIVHSFVPPP